MAGIALFTLPPSPRPSARLRERFNAVATDLGVGLRWMRDHDNPLVVQPKKLDVQPGFTERYGLKKGLVPAKFNAAIEGDVRRVLAAVEERRLAAVAESAHYHRRIPYRAPLDILSPAEQGAVALFAETVVPPLNRIEARQQDPNAPMLADWMGGHGDYYSIILFNRFRRDALAGAQFEGPEFSLFPFFPDLPPINGMMSGFESVDEFQKFAATLPPEAEELRPTTFLSRNVMGSVTSTPLPLHPDFRSDHMEMADALDRIAALEVRKTRLDPRLEAQLKVWARFFRTGTAEDEAVAMQATIDAGEGGGNLRVNIGPSESYWDDNTKFPYLLQVGVRDRGMAARLAAGAATFLDLEASLTGIPHYQPRQLSARGGFADPMYQAITAGFLQTFARREPLGNNIPNYDPYASRYGVEGGNRFIALEALAAMAPPAKVALNRLLDEDLSGWDASAAIAAGTIDHESGHLIGPPRGHVTPDGQRMGPVFGRHWGSADEAKADLTGAQRVRLMRAAGKMDAGPARDLMRAALGLDLSNRYRGKRAFAAGLTDHFYGHMIQVGEYFSTGALKLTGGTAGRGPIAVDYDTMEAAAHGLWRTIIAFQAAGDLRGFLAHGERLVQGVPDAADRMILDANKDQPMIFVERYV